MYETLKSIARTVIPNSFLKKWQGPLRELVALRYRGSNVACPLCESTFSGFIKIQRKEGFEDICPKCGSLPRKRLLWLYLKEHDHLLNRSTILHFSPHWFLEKRLRQIPDCTYHSTDYESNDADLHLDITAMDREDQQYDLIICYHVLEHIPDDRAAMRELHRILKPGGTLITQVPHREQTTHEDPTIVEPSERLAEFGQEDHVRYYGREDFVTRLTESGFAVNEVQFASKFEEVERQRLGLNDEEIIFVCKEG